jgi:hypothetical protein
VHCDVLALVQVSADVQDGIAVHAGQEVCAAVRKCPDVQLVHCDEAALVQVSADVQKSTGVHGVHTVGMVADRQ